jgi:hypothetical protein
MKLSESLRALDLAFRIYHHQKHYLSFTTPLARQFWRLTMYPAFLQFLEAQSDWRSPRIAPERLMIAAAALRFLP